MRFGRLRLAAIAAILTGMLLGVLLGWATPIFLNPFIKPDMIGGALFMGLFLVIIPLIGYFEMVLFWEQSRFHPALKDLRQSPQIGMGIIAPASIGLAIGLGLGWAAPNLG